MSTTSSTNMSLPIPGVGNENGPQWATDLNNSLTIIDAHDHSSGSGVQITPSGLSINADLTFQTTSSITNIKKVGFTSQSSALTGTNFLSFISGNLYVNDSSGNQIPITSGGGVAGSPGSIGSLASPAAATYTAGSKLFTWTADSGKAAAMDNGAVTIRETNVASAKGITLASPTSLAADYQLTFPVAVPASTQYLTSNSSGVLSFSTSNTILAAVTASVAAASNAILSAATSWTPTSTVANSIAASMTSTGANTIASTMTSSGADTIGSTMTATGADAIGNTMTSTGANAVGLDMTATGANSIAAARTRTTGNSVGIGGVAASSSCGTFTGNANTATQVTSLSLTIVTSGRPVYLAVISDSSLSPSTVTTGAFAPSFYIYSGSNEIAQYRVGANLTIPASFLTHIDFAGAGSKTYHVLYLSDGTNNISFNRSILTAYEL